MAMNSTYQIRGVYAVYRDRQAIVIGARCELWVDGVEDGNRREVLRNRRLRRGRGGEEE